MATEKKLPMPPRPKAGARKQDWVNYLAAHGVSVEVARGMTMPQLQSWEPTTPTSAGVKAEAMQPDPVQDDRPAAKGVEITAGKGAGGGGDYAAAGRSWQEMMDNSPGAMTIEQWERFSPPNVHESWCRVMEAVRSVAKGDYNKDQRFHFRGVDAVVDAVGPALRAYKVHIRPRRIISTTATEYTSKSGSRMVNRLVHVEWEVTGPQGDSFLGESMGEAADSSDKSLSKAQSVAYRVYLLQSLSIPTGDDPDFETHERATMEEAQRQQPSGRGYSSREEYDREQQRRQAQAGEENQTAQFPESSNTDPWTGAKPEEAQQDNRQQAQPDIRAPKERAEMWGAAKQLGWEWGRLAARFKSDYGIETAVATAEQLNQFKTAIIMEADDEERAKSLVQNELGGREVSPDGPRF